MTVIKKRRIEKSLKGKGFKKERTSSGHDYWYFYYQDKITTIRTTMSRSSEWKEYDDSKLKKKQDDLKLNKQQTVDFLNCPMSEDVYIAHLQEK